MVKVKLVQSLPKGKNQKIIRVTFSKNCTSKSVLTPIGKNKRVHLKVVGKWRKLRLWKNKCHIRNLWETRFRKEKSKTRTPTATTNLKWMWKKSYRQKNKKKQNKNKNKKTCMMRTTTKIWGTCIMIIDILTWLILLWVIRCCNTIVTILPVMRFIPPGKKRSYSMIWIEK